MLICESCGAVFEYPATKMDNDTGYVEESCPGCGSEYITNAVKCQRCEEWVSEDSAFGYGNIVVCEDCLQKANGDLDLLYAATKDECEDFELPVLFRTFFTDDEIKEILMRELKACHEQIPRDTKAFVRRYANEIADEMVKEDQKQEDHRTLEDLAVEAISLRGRPVPVENYERLLHLVRTGGVFGHAELD